MGLDLWAFEWNLLTVDYASLKLIHILSATVLFGTGLGSAFYMFTANRERDLMAQRFVVRFVVLADFLFTLPAVFVQLITGAAMVEIGGYAYTDFWVLTGLSLYVFAGMCWLPVVWLQIRMRDMIDQAAATGNELPDRYWTYNVWWIMLGSLAFPAVLIIFYVMVTKPILAG